MQYFEAITVLLSTAIIMAMATCTAVIANAKNRRRLMLSGDKVCCALTELLRTGSRGSNRTVASCHSYLAQEPSVLCKSCYNTAKRYGDMLEDLQKLQQNLDTSYERSCSAESTRVSSNVKINTEWPFFSQ